MDMYERLVQGGIYKASFLLNRSRTVQSQGFYQVSICARKVRTCSSVNVSPLRKSELVRAFEFGEGRNPALNSGTFLKEIICLANDVTNK